MISERERKRWHLRSQIDIEKCASGGKRRGKLTKASPGSPNAQSTVVTKAAPIRIGQPIASTAEGRGSSVCHAISAAGRVCSIPGFQYDDSAFSIPRRTRNARDPKRILSWAAAHRVEMATSVHALGRRHGRRIMDALFPGDKGVVRG